MRHRERKASPTGLMQITMCSLSCTLLMKWENIPSLGKGRKSLVKTARVIHVHCEVRRRNNYEVLNELIYNEKDSL